MVEMKNLVKEADAHPDDWPSESLAHRPGVLLGDQLRGRPARRHALSRQRRSHFHVRRR